MNQPTPVARDIAEMRRKVVGKRFADFQIYGVNSLKTLRPAPVEVIGQQVLDLTVNTELRKLAITSDRCTVDVDLARTGTIVFLEQAAAWRMSEGGSMPTARMIFDDGTGIDFREPAKTKRIAFTLHLKDV
jgi:hypothetical protein